MAAISTHFRIHLGASTAHMGMFEV